MSKKRHQNDKLYISRSQHIYEWGGKRSLKNQLRQGDLAAMEKLPFDHCALSMRPFINPVATPDGYVFDFINIVPYLRKKSVNPVNNQPLKMKDLTKIKFHKNTNGQYYCPITFKVFNDFSHLIAIKQTGNVFSYQAYQQLNKGPKYWFDLLTEEQFDPKSVITIQDPKKEENRLLSKFHFLNDQEQLNLVQDITLNQVIHSDKAQDNLNQQTQIQKVVREQIQKKKKQEEKAKNVQDFKQQEKQIKPIVKESLLTTRKRLESSLEDKSSLRLSPEQFIKLRKSQGRKYHNRDTDNSASISFTSTKINISQENKVISHSSDEIRKQLYYEVKSRHFKGTVMLITNLGTLNLEIHSDYVPKTSENFISLCQKGYYNNVAFHRLVTNFMIQGGDPKGTGIGGESAFQDGEAFEDQFSKHLSHDKKGIVSMANSGSNTNKSQFFITFGPCLYLDQKHSVFGEVTDGLSVLDAINLIKPLKDGKPSKEVKIIEAKVLNNPFKKASQIILQKEYKAKLEKTVEQMDLIRKKQKLSALISKNSSKNNQQGACSKIGKYLQLKKK